LHSAEIRRIFVTTNKGTDFITNNKTTTAMQTTTNTTATANKIFTIQVSIWGLDDNNKLQTVSTTVVEVVAATVWEAFKLVDGCSKNCLGSREITVEPQPIEEPAMVEEVVFEVAELTTEEKEEFAAFVTEVAVQKEEQFVQMTNDMRQIRFGFQAGKNRTTTAPQQQQQLATEKTIVFEYDAWDMVAEGSCDAQYLPTEEFLKSYLLMNGFKAQEIEIWLEEETNRYRWVCDITEA
jgi:hypothetical protein